MNILYFAPIRLYPKGHGNIATVHQYIQRLRQYGHKVHYVYCEEYPASTLDLFLAQDFVDTLDFILCSSPKRQPNGYYVFDTFYQDGMGEKIKKLCEIYKIDTVICTYVMHSKFLEYLPDTITKIIDTHDKMTDRHLFLRANKIKDEFFSCTREDEACYLSRADIIWARRDEETDYFNKITYSNKTITVSHFDNPNYLENKPVRVQKIGFLASDNNVNAKAVKDFVEVFIAQYQKEKIDIELVIGGAVNRILEKDESFMDSIRDLPITFLGRVNETIDFYNDIDVVICPIMFGTGINVKMIEAMSFGMPVVSTKCGIKGVDSTSSYHNAETLEKLTENIWKLYKNQNDIIELRNLSKQHFNVFFKKNSQNFDKCFGIPSAESLSSEDDDIPKDEKDCSGCGICAGLCPRNALSMELKNGFYRPVKNDKCTECGLCEKICAFAKRPPEVKAPHHDCVFGDYFNIYATHSKDIAIRRKSSTGGFIRMFVAEHLHKFDGVVSLTETDNPLQPEVELLRDVESCLKRMAKSKYFACPVSKIAEILKKNKGHYLVIGLPCQIAALKNATTSLKSNFFSIELFCGAVYNIDFMQKYFDMKGIAPTRIDFRDKRYGWHACSLNISNDEKEIVTPANEDEFYFAQRNKIFTQDTCLSCQYCHNGLADMQIGDFWGSKYQHDDGGVNLVISRSAEAEKLLAETTDIHIEKCQIRDVYTSQPWFVDAWRRNVAQSRWLPVEKTLSFKQELNRKMLKTTPYLLNKKVFKKLFYETYDLLKQQTKTSFSTGGFLLVSPDCTMGSFGDQAMVTTLINHIRAENTQTPVGLFNMYDNCEDGVLLNYGIDVPHYFPEGNRLEKFKQVISSYETLIIIGADVLDGGCGIDNAKAYWELAETAHKLGKKVIVTGFSFNKTQNSELIDIVRKASAYAQLNVRDSASFERLKNHGCDNLIQVADMAFLFDETQYPMTETTQNIVAEIQKQKNNGKKIIGLHLTHSPDKGYKTFLNKVVSALPRHNIHVVVVPHDIRVYAEKYPDRTFAMLIADELKRQNIPFTNAIDLENEAAVKTVVKLFDMVITSRMHLAIAALSRNVPPISFAYQDKFEGLYRLFQFGHDLIFNEDTFEVPDLQEAIDFVLGHDFTETMAQANEKIAQLSNKNFDFLNKETLHAKQ